jgi:hypothetical protein
LIPGGIFGTVEVWEIELMPFLFLAGFFSFESLCLPLSWAASLDVYSICSVARHPKAMGV